MNYLAGVLDRHPRHALAMAAAIGLAACAAPRFALACAAIALAALIAACGARPHVAVAFCAVLIAASALGQARLRSIDADPLAAAPAKSTIELRGYLLEHPRRTVAGFSMRVRAALAGGRSQTVEVSTDRALPATAAIGDEIVARGRLVAVDAHARTPGSSAYARYLLRNGVRRRLRADAVMLTGGRRGGVAGVVDVIRRRAERTLAAGLPPEPGALLRGMVLGGDNGIPDATANAFRIAGLTHILAVSGQNVMLLVILVEAIATGIGLGRLPRLLIPVGLICVYVPLCGAQASVVRAGVMGLVALAALLASRPSSRAYALILGAIAVLAYNPRATADVGAQLSFVAVLGIMAFTRPIAARLRRWPRWAAEAFAATTGATLATAPLMAYHFGTFSLVSLLANVLAEPLIGPIVWLGSAAAVIGQVWPAAGALLNAPNGFLLGSLITLAHCAAAVPGAQLKLPGFGALTLALVSLPIVVAAAAVNGAWPGAWRRRPPWSRRPAVAPGTSGAVAGKNAPARRVAGSHRLARRAAPSLLLFVASLCALLIALFGWRSAPPSLPRPSIVFLDVGQGDATLLLGTKGCEALIDGGPPGHDLPARLTRLGVDRLELVVATHPQLDHDGGLAEIARAGRPSIAALFDGGGNAGDPRIADLRARLAASHAASEPAEAGRSWSCGDLAVNVIGPPPARPGAAAPTDPNTRAAVTVADVGGIRLLTSADAESPQLLPLPLPTADVFKAPHHGSADAGLGAVLARVRPKIAVIEVGRDNPYGHPTAQALAALAASGARVYRTDRDGTVVVAPAGAANASAAAAGAAAGGLVVTLHAEAGG